jgi:hypothetical protein
MVTASQAFCVGRHVVCSSLVLSNEQGEVATEPGDAVMEDQTRVDRTGLPPRGDTLMLVAMLTLAVVWTFSIFYALVVVAT